MLKNMQSQRYQGLMRVKVGILSVCTSTKFTMQQQARNNLEP